MDSLIQIASINVSSVKNENFEPEINVGNENTERIIKSFAEETDEHKRALIKNWSLRCFQWMNEARQLSLKYDRIKYYLEKYTVTANQNFNNFVEMMNRVKQTQEIINAEEEIQDRSLLRKGYLLINEIGEKIRGEEILYSVTITSTGGAISSGVDVYTVKVNMGDFLKYYAPNLNSRTSLTELNLKGASTLAKMARNQALKGQIEKWSEDKISNYVLYSEQITNARNQHFENTNNGQILEAFLRYIEGGNPVKYSKESSYWGPLIHSMKSTLKAPDAFWKGGEGGSLGQTQVKWLNASITNIGSLINIINETLKTLSSTRVGANTLASYIGKEELKNFIDGKGNKTAKQAVDDLMQLFTTGVIR